MLLKKTKQNKGKWRVLSQGLTPTLFWVGSLSPLSLAEVALGNFSKKLAATKHSILHLLIPRDCSISGDWGQLLFTDSCVRHSVETRSNVPDVVNA